MRKKRGDRGGGRRKASMYCLVPPAHTIVRALSYLVLTPTFPDLVFMPTLQMRSQKLTAVGERAPPPKPSLCVAGARSSVTK